MNIPIRNKYNKIKNLKAFTLIEVILVVSIIGLLAGILFKTYITMSQISFRVEQQKVVNQELLFVTETLQNLANRNHLDYERYENNDIKLTETKGIVNVLYMTGEDGIISMFSTGSCIGINEELEKEHLDEGCNLVLEKNGKVIVLTKELVYITDIVFKIIPFADDDGYLQNMDLCDSNYLACIGDYGFWFTANIYSRGYSNDWTNKVSIFVQQFFNI